MDAKDAIELVLLLLIFATALAYLARRLRDRPIRSRWSLAGSSSGFVLAAIPDAPTVQLPPDIVFLLFLPPILFGSGYFTQIRDFKANRAPSPCSPSGSCFSRRSSSASSRAPWSPPRPGAGLRPRRDRRATGCRRGDLRPARLGVPRRVVTILEGESLVNDASALIAYRVAVAAVVTGSFALLDASVSFVVVGVGGVLVGIVIGWVITTAWRRTGEADAADRPLADRPDLRIPHRRGLG